MQWGDLNPFATEHLVFWTRLSAEECQARLKAKLRPRYWWRMPSTEIYPVVGQVKPTAFSISKSDRRYRTGPIRAIGRLEPQGRGTKVAIEVRLKRSSAIYWSMVMLCCLAILLAVIINGVFVATGTAARYSAVGFLVILMFLAQVIVGSMVHGIALTQSRGTGQFLKLFVSQLLESRETRAWRTRW